MWRYHSLLVTSVAVLLSLGLGTMSKAQDRTTQAAVGGKQRVYLGTYTKGDSKGIYHCQLDLSTGALTKPQLAAQAINPSFLALHPNGRFVYAVNEVTNFGGKKTGAVTAYQIKEDGSLKLLNQKSTHGGAPCHVVVDGTGQSVLVANYVGGSTAALPLDDHGFLHGVTGLINHEGSSVHKSRQKGPHAHSINVSPDNRFVFAADLGIDKVLVFRYDARSAIFKEHEPAWNDVAPGSGPRHFAFHPSGQFAYVINEMLSTVTAFSYDIENGKLTELHTIGTLPKGFEGRSSTAEVQVHPSGKFVYGSNRGHDSIVIFAVDPKTGKLSLVGHQSTGGKTPRNFGIDPTGQYILAANQNSHTVVVFKVDLKTGKLTPTGHKIEVPSPVCVKFLPLK